MQAGLVYIWVGFTMAQTFAEETKTPFGLVSLEFCPLLKKAKKILSVQNVGWK